MELPATIGFISEKAQENWLRELLLAPVELAVEQAQAPKPRPKTEPISQRPRQVLPQ